MTTGRFQSECARGLFLVLFLLAGLLTGAQADDLGYALMIQQSPAEGGTIDPGVGVLKVGIGETMTLTALPRPGFHFVYWLGDVADPSSNTTRVRLDSPKMVVAVYERDTFDEEMSDKIAESLQVNGASGGGAGRSPTPLSLSRGGGLMSVSAGSYDYNGAGIYTPPSEENDPFPLPEDSPKNDDLSVPNENPVPEPATLCLLAAGSVLMRLRQQKRI